MGDTSGLKAAQHDQGEARRSGVMSRPLRRLALGFARPIQLATKNLQYCHFCSLSSDHSASKLSCERLLHPKNSLLIQSMKTMVRRIAEELKHANQCGVYEPDLSRFWPSNGQGRETEIALFAELHGLRLRYYKEGFCAIFDKDPYR